MAQPDRPLRADAARNRARVLEVAYDTFAAEGLAVPIDEIARTAVEALWGQVARPFERQPSYVFRPRLRLGGTTAAPSSALATS